MFETDSAVVVGGGGGGGSGGGDDAGDVAALFKTVTEIFKVVIGMILGLVFVFLYIKR